MQRVRVYIATSVDGFIAGPDNDLSFLDGLGQPDPDAPESGALDFGAFLAQVGAMVMGRNTYDVISGFDGWHYGELPVLVPTHRPLEAKVPTVRPVSGDINAILDQALEAAGDKDVYVDGGALIRQALDAGRVDELVLSVAPIILGQGVPLFAGVASPHRLEIVAHHTLGKDMVQMVFRPAS